MIHRPVALLAPIVALLAGCADPDADLDELAFADLAGEHVSTRCTGCDWGPPILNTHSLEQVAYSELDTQGLFHDGWRLIEVRLVLERGHEIPLASVWADGGLLHGLDEDGNLYSGGQFVDSEWTIATEPEPEEPTLTTPGLWAMRVTEFYEGVDGRSRYTFNNGPDVQSIEAFNCERDDETGEYSAVLFSDLQVDSVTGTHSTRPNTIYFGCTSGAVGKAAMWGYAPHFAGDDAHQAATRAVRADYCGNGTPFTQAGTPLQIADVWGYEWFTDATRTTEAMWTPEGAACLMQPRRPEYTYDTVECPGVGLLPYCESTTDFSDWDALLWTKVW